MGKRVLLFDFLSEVNVNIRGVPVSVHAAHSAAVGKARKKT